jgi:LuxR family maltose regulon positive regulatory protein
LAAALWEQDETDAAETTLANRLDVIERTAVPEAIALAYVTLARIALDRRDIGRVNDLAEGLYALGVQRRQPRMIATSLAEAVRVEALLQRGDACARAIARLREQRETWREAERGVGPIIQWMCGVAEIRAALCARDAEGASKQAARLLRSQSIGWTRGRLEVLALQFVAERMLGRAPRYGGSAEQLLRTPYAQLFDKEIARALDVGPTTVKWHLRNLFGKLNVGGRRHAVQRARMLQLVEAEAIVQ